MAEQEMEDGEWLLSGTLHQTTAIMQGTEWNLLVFFLASSENKKRQQINNRGGIYGLLGARAREGKREMLKVKC